MNRATLRRDVASTARRLAAEGLLIGSAGNVSARCGDVIAVTATGVTLAECDVDDVTEVDRFGEVMAGTRAPTSELGLHLGVYETFDTAAVVHTHAPFSTAVACLDGLAVLPVLHYQQLVLGGDIPIVPYAPFGSDELAAGVVEALRGRQATLMANHGSVAVGTDLEAALQNVMLLEWLAELYQRTRSMGRPRALTPDQQSATIIQAVALQYGTRKDGP